mmetsp:Transcript_18888/g.45290  ORF Transcript_18888/g.45290 Transcript_18888/m.45290 type:complete len:430 (+) Transcript_18888:427-1716(+)
MIQRSRVGLCPGISSPVTSKAPKLRRDSYTYVVYRSAVVHMQRITCTMCVGGAILPSRPTHLDDSKGKDTTYANIQSRTGSLSSERGCAHRVPTPSVCTGRQTVRASVGWCECEAAGEVAWCLHAGLCVWVGVEAAVGGGDGWRCMHKRARPTLHEEPRGELTITGDGGTELARRPRRQPRLQMSGELPLSVFCALEGGKYEAGGIRPLPSSPARGRSDGERPVGGAPPLWPCAAAAAPPSAACSFSAAISAALVFRISLASCIFCIDDLRIVSTFFRSRGPSCAICGAFIDSSLTTFCISTCCSADGHRRIAVLSDLMHCSMISSSRCSSTDDSFFSSGAATSADAAAGSAPEKSIRSCSQSSACSSSSASEAGRHLSAVSRGDSMSLRTGGGAFAVVVCRLRSHSRCCSRQCFRTASCEAYSLGHLG